MRKTPVTSKSRFDEYRTEIFAGQESAAGKKMRRDRSAWQLVANFLRLAGRQWRPLAFALGTLTIATILALIPPASTKIVVENVLGDTPLPTNYPEWLPRDPWQLLVAIVAGGVCYQLGSAGATRVGALARHTGHQTAAALDPQKSVRPRHATSLAAGSGT